MSIRLLVKNSFFRFLTCTLLLQSERLVAIENIDSKAQLTAAFIYQITKFTSWPETIFVANNQSFSICVLGQPDSELFEYLAALETKSSQGRPIEIVRLKNKQELLERVDNTCEVLFTSTEVWENLSAQEVSQLSQTTLLIGTSKHFLQLGGMLALIVVDNKMKIYINSSNIENTPIKVESRLKALAKSI